MVRKYTGNKASVKTAEALAREGLKQEEKAEKAMEAQKKPAYLRSGCMRRRWQKIFIRPGSGVSKHVKGLKRT